MAELVESIMRVRLHSLVRIVQRPRGFLFEAGVRTALEFHSHSHLLKQIFQNQILLKTLNFSTPYIFQNF